MMYATDRGRFLTLEGIEGAGKSSQVERVAELVQRHGRRVHITREPGGTTVGEEIRKVLLSTTHAGMSMDAELLLVFAARAEHLAKVVRPALDDGVWVICDRFTDATYAYQGGGRGMEFKRIAAIEKWVQGSLAPDHTLLFDVPVSIGLARAGSRSSTDRFESEAVSFFERVRGTYLKLAATSPKRFRVIDAGQALRQVSSAVDEAVSAWLTTN